MEFSPDREIFTDEESCNLIDNCENSISRFEESFSFYLIKKYEGFIFKNNYNEILIYDGIVWKHKEYMLEQKIVFLLKKRHNSNISFCNKISSNVGIITHHILFFIKRNLPKIPETRNVLCFSNGTYNLEGRFFRDSRIDDYCTFQIDYEFQINMTSTLEKYDELLTQYILNVSYENEIAKYEQNKQKFLSFLTSCIINSQYSDELFFMNNSWLVQTIRNMFSMIRRINFDPLEKLDHDRNTIILYKKHDLLISESNIIFIVDNSNNDIQPDLFLNLLLLMY